MHKIHRGKLFYAVLVLVVAGGVFAALELTNTTHVLKKTPVSKPSAVINKLPAQPATNNGQKDVAGNSSSVNQQTATDQSGKNPGNVSSDPGKWLTSESGNITVKLPTVNSTFKPGDNLYGSAKVSKVQYRLVDNQAGVISQGFISVVSGNFSASVNFKPYASSGQLDVFSIDSTGKELNEVQVAVNF